jgi:adenine phosphoribosyltransferase
VIATGGTAAAVAKLVRRQQGVLAGCAVVIELAFLDGRARLEDCPLVSLIRY